MNSMKYFFIILLLSFFGISSCTKNSYYPIDDTICLTIFDNYIIPELYNKQTHPDKNYIRVKPHSSYSVILVADSTFVLWVANSDKLNVCLSHYSIKDIFVGYAAWDLCYSLYGYGEATVDYYADDNIYTIIKRADNGSYSVHCDKIDTVYNIAIAERGGVSNYWTFYKDQNGYIHGKYKHNK